MMALDYHSILKDVGGNAKLASKIYNLAKQSDSYEDTSTPPMQYAPPQQPQIDNDAIERIASKINSNVERDLSDYKHRLTDEMGLHLDGLNQRISQYGQKISRFIAEYPSKNSKNGGKNVEDFAVCRECLLGFEKDEFLSFNGKCPKCGNQLLIRSKGISGKNDDGSDLVGGLILGGVGGAGVLYAVTHWDEISKFFDEFLTDLGISPRSFSPRSRHIPRYSPRKTGKKSPVYLHAKINPPAPVPPKEFQPLGAQNKMGVEEDELRVHEPEPGATHPYSE